MIAAASASSPPDAAFDSAPALPSVRARAPLPPPAFTIPVRVYYEDTDAGGIVYYANWLRYFERARTDWLRALGAAHRSLDDRFEVLLVVREISIDYRRPARLDDELVVDVRLQEARRATCLLWQTARLAGEDEPLVVARVRIAAVRRGDGRPTGFPRWLSERLSAEAANPSTGNQESPMERK